MRESDRDSKQLAAVLHLFSPLIGVTMHQVTPSYDTYHSITLPHYTTLFTLSHHLTLIFSSVLSLFSGMSVARLVQHNLPPLPTLERENRRCRNSSAAYSLLLQVRTSTCVVPHCPSLINETL